MTAPLVLYCLPYAGGTARAFAPLAKLAPSHLRIRAVEPPGRGARLREPLIDDYRTLVGAMTDYLVADLLSTTGAAPRYALLGHSAGATLGVAVAGAMAGVLGQPPVRCFLIAAEPPHLAPRHQRPTPPSDQELLDRLAGYRITAPELLAEPAFVQHILPIMRADLGVVAQYHQASSIRVDIPFTLVAAGADPTAPPHRVWAWSRHTSGPCRRVLLAGDHFSILHAPRPLLDAVTADLAADPAGDLAEETEELVP